MALSKPKLVPQISTLWDYPSQHYGDGAQGSQAFRGATPSYVIWNVVHRFTAEGAKVLSVPTSRAGTWMLKASSSCEKTPVMTVGALMT